MWIAIIIFLVAYLGIVSEKFPRHWVALSGGIILVLAGVMTLEEAFLYINWETIGLLTGMFILVSILNDAGFFNRLAILAIRKVNYHPSYIFILLIFLAACFAMIMDSITVMLFLSALTLQLCRLMDLDPIPLIIAEVCAANIGGSATLVGDPPNVILGTTLGFNFLDFLTHTGPISILSGFIVLILFYMINRKGLIKARRNITSQKIIEINKDCDQPLQTRMTRIGMAGLIAAIVLLIIHIPVAEITGLPFNSALAALIPAIFTIIALRPDQQKRVMRKVDTESLLFFTGLFILIGGLEKVHLFETLAGLLEKLIAGGTNTMILAIHWGPGLASAIVDNVPLSLAMSYVLKDLNGIAGMPALSLMVWSLALGVNMGGNLTPIGASANVVAYSYIERNHGEIGWKRWVLLASPPTLIVMALACILLVFKGQIGWF